MKGMRRILNVNEIASLGSNVKPVIQNELSLEKAAGVCPAEKNSAFPSQERF